MAARELRNHTAEVLRRVSAGKEVTVTVRGEPVARLVAPADRRPEYWTAGEVVLVLLRSAADPGLAEDLAAAVPESTDDLRDPR